MAGLRRRVNGNISLFSSEPNDEFAEALRENNADGDQSALAPGDIGAEKISPKCAVLIFAPFIFSVIIFMFMAVVPMLTAMAPEGKSLIDYCAEEFFSKEKTDKETVAVSAGVESNVDVNPKTETEATVRVRSGEKVGAEKSSVVSKATQDSGTGEAEIERGLAFKRLQRIWKKDSTSITNLKGHVIRFNGYAIKAGKVPESAPLYELVAPNGTDHIVILVGDDETTAVVYPIFCFKKEQFEALPEFKDINCTIIQGRLLRAMKGNGQYEGKYILLFDDCRVIEQ